MNRLEKLEEKLESKVKLNETEKVDNGDTENVNYLKLNSQIDAVYRLINNVSRRIERNLADVNNKQNIIIKMLENEGVDVEEIKRLQEIEELENKLKKLKKEV